MKINTFSQGFDFSGGDQFTLSLMAAGSQGNQLQ